MTDADAGRFGTVGRVIRKIGRIIRNYFVVVGVLVTFLPLALGYLIATSHRRAHVGETPALAITAAKPGRLRLSLTGKIAEQEPGFSEQLVARFFQIARPLYLPELRATLREAASDKRVSGLAVDIGALHGSQADYAELRRILADFRASGNKPVDVALSEAEDWNYYIATAGDRLILEPASPVSIPGPTFQLVYFGDLLKKLGVSIDVVRAGKYKSAFEPFVANAPSEPTLEEYRTMQESLLDHIVTTVAQGRKKDAATVRGWYKRSIYTADEAVKEGMVDAIGYGADLVRNSDWPTVAEYAAATRGSGDDGKLSVSDKGGIGLIEAVGEINMTKSSSGPAGGDEGIDPRSMARQIHWAMTDDQVKAVVLRVSSPGGSAIASDIIAEDLRALAKVKPLVVSMGAYAASGGYYISAPARYIVSEPTTITGSIGVIGMMPSAEAFPEKWGINFYAVTSSDRKAMLSLGSRATPEDKALIESTIAQDYKAFVKAVADGRKLSVAKVEDLAQGRAYTGLQAKQLGLVDEIGGLNAAFTQAKKLAGFDPAKLYPVLHYEEEGMSLSECLGGPMKFIQCLEKGDARLGLSPWQIVRAASGAEPVEARVARRVESWITEARAEHALALWPAYLGTTLR